MKQIHLIKYVLVILAFFSLAFMQNTKADIGTSIIMNTPIDDSGIISRVQTAIDTNPTLQGESITVTSNQGVVTLEGEVEDESQINTAIQIAKNTVGVLEVNSDITLKNPIHDERP